MWKYWSRIGISILLRNNISHTKGSTSISVPIPVETINKQFYTLSPKNFPILPNRHWQTQGHPQNWRNNYTPQNFRQEAYEPKMRPPIPPRYPVINHESLDVDGAIQLRRVNYIKHPRPMIKWNITEKNAPNKQ